MRLSEQITRQALEHTTRLNRSRHLRDLLRQNHSETPDTSQIVNVQVIDRSNDGSRRDGSLIQVPINVTVEEPRARVVRLEPDRDIIAISSDAHNVTDDWVNIVVGVVARAADNVECVAVQVDGVLQTNYAAVRSRLLDLENLHRLTGPPRTPAGMEISTL